MQQFSLNPALLGKVHFMPSGLSLNHGGVKISISSESKRYIAHWVEHEFVLILFIAEETV